MHLVRRRAHIEEKPDTPPPRRTTLATASPAYEAATAVSAARLAKGGTPEKPIGQKMAALAATQPYKPREAAKGLPKLLTQSSTAECQKDYPPSSPQKRY